MISRYSGWNAHQGVHTVRNRIYGNRRVKRSKHAQQVVHHRHHERSLIAGRRLLACITVGIACPFTSQHSSPYSVTADISATTKSIMALSMALLYTVLGGVVHPVKSDVHYIVVPIFLVSCGATPRSFTDRLYIHHWSRRLFPKILEGYTARLDYQVVVIPFAMGTYTSLALSMFAGAVLGSSITDAARD